MRAATTGSDAPGVELAVCCVSLALVQLLALVPPVRRWALLMRDRTR